MTKLNNDTLHKLKQEAKHAAITAGQYIQSQFDEQYIKQSKVGGDSLASQVVTEVDLKAQEIILDGLQNSMQTYDLGLLTEELVDDGSRLEKSHFWCIDPMDGTLPFTEHRTGYAVSIALISRAGDPVIGVVYIPDLERCYTAIKGGGVMVNDDPFIRESSPGETLHFYMDSSFLSEPYYDKVKAHFDQLDRAVEYHSSLGGVRNAISVMSSGSGCYFKFPKPRKGCGSIWDYAATGLFFEELGLHVTDSNGNRLHLNNPETTFMNHGGVLFATDQQIAAFIMGLREKV
ncbi:3'(2'),5'-bisphosphate nucleotidase CysQ [Marinoscillum sp. MHG1-6]|uniref:3'(2'),5'-bisphosphate nucleotidase CysQ family protein n=1 Tax=Marinoscillum sp. MHG1-6 TaxID=2959627 RepID=UPI002157BBC7|nr:inositol monophosphatase family protein [Marinoscillum sp. MHG1-6]